MEVKLFEVRDRMTFIPVIAIRLMCRDSAEYYLLRRTGYAEEHFLKLVHTDTPYVLMTALHGGETCNYDAHAWPNRTKGIAHQFILEHWPTLQSGQVIDVQFILGETPAPKQSERIPDNG